MERTSDQLLIIQSTPFCNIDCRYCYLPNRSDKHRMTPETFDRVIANIVQAGIYRNRFTVAWHAGEPLAVPMAFYRECLAVTARYSSPALAIEHNFQTNGTLIDDDWAAFIKANDISVGLSIDGPAELHDRHRVDRAGRGTFERVMRGMAALKRHGVPFCIICVLTYEHLARVEELFHFLRDCGPEQIIFNFDEREGSHRETSFAAADAVPRFREFVSRMLRLNRAHGNPLSFRNIVVDLLGERDPRLNHQVVPWRILSVDWQGNVCTFSPELLGTRDPAYDNFLLGNLAESSIAEISARPTFRRLRGEIERGIKRCRAECEYFDWCGGGAPSNKYFELGSFEQTETIYCRLMRKAVCDANLDLIEADVQEMGTAKAARSQTT